MDATPFIRDIILKRDKIPSFEEYPFSLRVVRRLDTLALHPAVTFIIGENGSGKSTLLEAIAAAAGFNPEGGGRNFAFSTRASHSALHEYLRLSRSARRPRDGYFLRAESFFNVATEIERLDREQGGGPKIIESYGGVSLHEQSHGESFLSLMTQRFGGQGLYILDEPEAALSPSRQMAVLARIHQLVRAESQFIIATHSPIIMAYPEAAIHAIAEEGITQVAYTDTEHYRDMKHFLNKHEQMVRELMAE